MTTPSGFAGFGLVASGTIERFRFVKVSGDRTAAAAGANENAIGISGQGSRRFDDASAADAGEQVEIQGQDGNVALLELGGTVSAGDYIKSGAAGVGVAAATTGTTVQLVRAIALVGGDSGDIITVKLVTLDVRPALT